MREETWEETSRRRKREQRWDEHEQHVRTFAEPSTEPVVLPNSEGVGRLADEIREVWSDLPKVGKKNVLFRFVELVAALDEILQTPEGTDLRAMIREALEDSK